MDTTADGTNVDRRREILDTAADLFLHKGFHGTTVRDLAHAARVSQPTLYYYIGRKMDALVAIHNSVIDELLPRMEELVATALPAEEKLRRFLLLQLEIAEERRSQVVAFLIEQNSLSPEAAEAIQPRRDRLETLLDQILREGVDGGRFRANFPVTSVRLAVLGMVHWFALCREPRPSARSAPEFADDLAKLILSGLVC